VSGSRLIFLKIHIEVFRVHLFRPERMLTIFMTNVLSICVFGLLDGMSSRVREEMSMVLKVDLRLQRILVSLPNNSALSHRRKELRIHLADIIVLLKSIRGLELRVENIKVLFTEVS
jgi:hypothetical protein